MSHVLWALSNIFADGNIATEALMQDFEGQELIEGQVHSSTLVQILLDCYDAIVREESTHNNMLKCSLNLTTALFNLLTTCDKYQLAKTVLTDKD